MTKLANYFKMLDMYGFEAKINHKHKTLFGSVCTILTLITIGGYALSTLVNDLQEPYKWKYREFEKNFITTNHDFILPH
jgi:hypothetical protein